MSSKNLLKKAIQLGLISAITGFSGSTLASGFAIPFPSITDLGTDAAGGAALAQDATTAYTNPAGLIRLQNQQIAASALGITTTIKFNGTMNNPGLPGFGTPVSETGSAKSTAGAIIPAFYYALPIADRWAFGLSVNTPFGLGDDYSENAITRYDVTYTQLASIDIGPSIAYKLTDKFSIGAGPDVVYFRLLSQAMSRTQPFTTQDSQSKMDLSSWGYGWHAGVLYQFTPQTRAGLTYHSQVVEQLEGTSKFYANGGALNGYSVSSNTQSTLPLPPITTLSAYHDFCNNWATMASIEYQQWSVYRHDRITNLAYPAALTGPINVLVPRNWQDTFRYAAGATYQLTPRWLLRAGTDYETGPSVESTRGVANPDVGSVGVTAGAHFQATKTLAFDGGYGHYFFFNSRINTTSPVTGNQLVGHSEYSGDALGLQMVWDL